mgnify:CR=1 FL=1
MPVISVAGSAFTVTIGATAYSAQVTKGTINLKNTVTRVKTLTDVAYATTDKDGGLSIEAIYDDETGLLGALTTAMTAGTSVSVTIVGGDTKWTGTAMYVETCDSGFDATNLATISATFTGVMSVTDNP